MHSRRRWQAHVEIRIAGSQHEKLAVPRLNKQQNTQCASAIGIGSAIGLRVCATPFSMERGCSEGCRCACIMGVRKRVRTHVCRCTACLRGRSGRGAVSGGGRGGDTNCEAWDFIARHALHTREVRRHFGDSGESAQTGAATAAGGKASQTLAYDGMSGLAARARVQSRHEIMFAHASDGTQLLCPFKHKP